MPRVKDFWEDFRQFAFKDNLVSLSVGVVIGTAFKNVSTSLVQDIIMPPIGLLLGRVAFSDLYVSLNGTQYSSIAEAQTAGAPIIMYGHFLTNCLDFFLTAISLYIVLRIAFRWKPNASVEVKK